MFGSLSGVWTCSKYHFHTEDECSLPTIQTEMLQKARIFKKSALDEKTKHVSLNLFWGFAELFSMDALVW